MAWWGGGGVEEGEARDVVLWSLERGLRGGWNMVSVEAGTWRLPEAQSLFYFCSLAPGKRPL